jgi:Domain of unknown function (DUF4157)
MSRTSALQARSTTAAPIIAAAVKTGTVQRKSAAVPSYLQRKALVSRSQDPAEREADTTARTVMSMPAPQVTTWSSGVQRKANDNTASLSVPAMNAAGGIPLPLKTRAFFEPRFKADFKNVRIHADAEAGRMARAINARAFASGNHIYFGKGEYQPDTPSGLELIAHELTHTIQQGAAVQRKEASPAISEFAGQQLQRESLFPDISIDPLDYVAKHASDIPGFDMFTMILGVNPVNMTRVDRSAANIMRAIVKILPGGGLITRALDAHGVFDKIGIWVEKQLATLALTGQSIKVAITKFIKSLSPGDILHLDSVWERGKQIFTAPIDRIKTFAGTLVDGIIKFIKDAILMPLAKLAEPTKGWDLLCAVLGKNPITDAKVEPTAANLVGGFMKFINQDEVWKRIQETGAIAKVWAWFQNAISTVKGFVAQLPALALAAFKALEVADIIVLPVAIGKIIKVFGNFATQFVTWAGTAVWKLLEIVFSVVSPDSWTYFQKTGAALRTILKNPIPFVKNLGKAAIDGFMGFKDGFLGYLQAGLIGWLTGNMPGVYIPKALQLKEIARFVLSVLGLTWVNLRAKLVKAIGETAVVVLETTFDIVVTLVRDGPAAAWEQIKTQLTNLKEMAIGAIIDFVVDMVTKKAIPKLISMFVPGLGFVSAIMSVYDMIMVIANRISQIKQLITGFVDSIVAIANGNTGAAAKKIESILANGLSLAIVFAAGFASIGRVADKLRAILEKIRAPFDKAMNWLVGWIKKAGQAILAKVMGRSNETPEQKQARLEKAAEETLEKVNKYAGKPVGDFILKPILALIKFKHGLTSIEPILAGDQWDVRLEINPVKVIKTKAKSGKEKLTLSLEYETRWPLDEFVSKAEAMKLAAKGKKRSDLGDIEKLVTLGSGKTKAKRKGGQARFRGIVHDFIDGNLLAPAAKKARVMMSQLQADHQQELQVGGSDDNANMAMIESSMNASMGSQIKNALNDEKIKADTTINDVVVLKTPDRNVDKGKIRQTGTARELQDHLVDPSGHKANVTKSDLSKVPDWFKLD